jgi:hypothetical protein
MPPFINSFEIIWRNLIRLNTKLAASLVVDVEEYKFICNRPDAFERGVLEASERELHSRHLPSALRLQEILKSASVSKPLLHTGGKHTDYFLVMLNVVEAEQIVEYLVDAEADAVREDGETAPQASRFGSLVDAWVRYIDFCDGMTS